MKQTDIIINNINAVFNQSDTLAFEGWGRCRKLIDTKSEEYADAYRQLTFIKGFDKAKKLLQSAQSSSLTSYYTPTDVAQTITQYSIDTYKSLNGRDAIRVLDPSCGVGAFVCKTDTSKYNIVACEKDEMTRIVLSKRMGDDITIINSYEELSHLARFDIITSNIPFGDVSVYDTALDKMGGVYKASQKKIHNYYFMKSMHLLRDGGILAFITSRGFLSSPKNQPFREEMLKHGTILNIIRLPDNIFKTVDVGSDLIIYQKTTQSSTNLGGVTPTLSDNDNLQRIFLNGWAEDNDDLQLHNQPGMCLPNIDHRTLKNQYGKLVHHYKYIGTNLANDLLSTLTTVLSDSVAEPTPTTVLDNSVVEPTSTTHNSNLPTHNSMKYSFLHYGHMFFFFFFNDNKIEQPLNELLSLYAKADTLTDDERNYMLDCYHAYLEEQNATSLHDITKRMDTGHNHILNQLEKKVNGQWQPADIFHRALNVSAKTILSPSEALASSLNLYGKVNLTHMEERTGMTSLQITDELREQMFFNPITGLYEEAESWLCGNVVKKAREAEQHINKWKDGELRNAERAIEALHNARPDKIPFNDIDCQFGSRWIPLDYYKKFICTFFEESESNIDHLDILYSQPTDEYVGEIYFWGHRELRVKGHDAGDVVMWALNGSIPNFTISIGDGKTIPDEEARALALKNVAKVKEEWQAYINLARNGYIREDVERIYNDRFNCEVKPKIDGSFQTFPDLDLKGLGIPDLYQSQKDCIWMLKKNGGGVCWHEVGTGKTLIMCVASYEMKRLGLVKKPVIIGMKANVGQIAETYRKAYPNAKLLYPKNSDFSANNRIQYLNQIKNNDWDCIIMSHDQFHKLPLALDTEIRLTEERISALDDILGEVKDRRFMNRILRGLQKRRDKMALELDKLNQKHRAKADDIEDFHQLGIDHIFVDESQVFKNLGFATRNTRVGGIGNPQGSQRADHLLNCIRDIQYTQGRDLGATFLSGTIVSNSLTELYLIFNYLRPNALAEQDIHSFDAWATVFCEKKDDFELNIVNQVRAKERFAAYVNVPELSKFLSQVCDYRTTEMIGLDAPKKEVHFEASAPTEQQEVMLDRLVSFAGGGDWSCLGINREAPNNLKESRMLVATDLCRKTALDPRMLDNCSTFGDEQGNKVRRCARHIYDIYCKTNADKGTQFVFNDVSTYDKDKWNMQKAVRDILVNEYGIPSSEVVFINAVSDGKRLETFDKMNKGEIRVLFGSTSKLGTGVNAQERCVAIHHLDIPWRGSDLEQRNGRGCRKGNWVAKERGNKVDVYMYATERTLDVFMYNTVKNKMLFIEQLNKGTVAVRRIDESILKSDDSVNMAEYVSILSGNTDLLDKSRIEAKVMALESQRKTFYSNRNDAVARVATMESENKRDAEWIRLAEQDVAYHTDINADTLITIKGKSVKDHKEAGKELYQIDADNRSNEYKVFGQCGSLQLAVRHEDSIYNPSGSNYFYIIGHSGQYYSCCMNGNKTGKLLHTGHENCAKYPYDTFSMINKTISEKTAHIAFNNSRLPEYRKLADSTWQGEEELTQLKADLDAINARIMATISDKPQAA